MMSDKTTHDGDRTAGAARGTPGFPGVLAGALALLVASACSNPLDVENPNNLVEEDLNTPTGVSAAVNGALAEVSDAFGEMGGPYATASGEMQNVGSRDAWQQLQYGNISQTTNEFTDGAFDDVGEGRYMADKAIALVEEFGDEIQNKALIPQAYLYGGIMYVTIADMMDNFVIPSDKTDPTTPGQPVGEDNMGSLYQTAIDYLTTGIQEAQSIGATDLETALLAMRARAHFSMAVWGKLNPAGSTPADPLVNSSSANADAAAVLGRVGITNPWTYDHSYGAQTVTFAAGDWNDSGYINLSDAFMTLDPEAPTVVTGVRIEDPIDQVKSPPLVAFMQKYTASPLYLDIPAVSAVEMHLILAEAALAGGDMGGFQTHINHVRSLNGVTPYSGQIPAEEMLIYTRKANLYMQGRWLSDLYRFGLQSDKWQPQSPAATTPGTFLPITITEIRSNPNVSG